MNISDIAAHLYHTSTTPFERRSEGFRRTEALPSSTFNTLKTQWIEVLSPKKDPEVIRRYFSIHGINEEELEKMLSSVEHVSNPPGFLPDWVRLLDEIVGDKSGDQSFNFGPFQEIPFVHLLLPFCRAFLRRVNHKPQERLPGSLIQQLQFALFKKLSNLSESIFQEEFEAFSKQYRELHSQLRDSSNDSSSDTIYQEFVRKQSEDNLRTLFFRFPMLARLLAVETTVFSDFVSSLLQRFKQNKGEIGFYFQKNISSSHITSIELDVADRHQAASTAIITLNCGFKVVFKPGSVAISHAYNSLIDWVNQHLGEALKTFNVIDKQDYGWLEFIHREECQRESEIVDYYRRAGILLGITYFLGSSDYHYENLIAAGNCPVLVDHETIIQPNLSEPFEPFKGSEKEKYLDSVLKPMLLPAVVPNSGLPYSYQCGFGSSVPNNLDFYRRCIVNCNSDRSRHSIRYFRSDQDKLNKPSLNGKKKHLRDYQLPFKEGFTNLYTLFENQKDQLLGKASPLNEFHGKQIRFVWRPTNVYVKIQKRLLKSEYLRCALQYGIQLELLARAYVKRTDFSDIAELLASERQQMLRGDIPIFKLNSDSRNLDLYIGENTILFAESAMDNVRRRIREANIHNYSDQIDLIDQYAPQ